MQDRGEKVSSDFFANFIPRKFCRENFCVIGLSVGNLSLLTDCTGTEPKSWGVFT